VIDARDVFDYSLFGEGVPLGVDDGTVGRIERWYVPIDCQDKPLQFAMQVLTGGCESPVWGKGWSHKGLEMGPLVSPVVTSYRLSIV